MLPFLHAEGSLPESHRAKSAWKSAGSLIGWCCMCRVPLAEDSVSFAITMARPVPGSEVVSATNLASGG